MLRSIRWRLVASYVFVTLLTVSMLGILAVTFVKQYTENQELTYLRSNAEAVAQQANQFFQPVTQQAELFDLANVTAYLGNVRVRILNADHDILVDTGSPTEYDQFLWVIPPREGFQFRDHGESMGTFFYPLQLEDGSDLSFLPEIAIPALFQDLPSETSYRYVHRSSRPWGNIVLFEEPPEHTEGMETYRSSRVYEVPIGDEENPHGYVELRESPDFSEQTLETTVRAFLIAAAGSVIFAGFVGLIVAKYLTTPLVKLTQAAGEMEGGDLSVRAPEYGQDEIGQLARQFNRMAERLEQSFVALAAERDTLRRFITDASHELRTPITALRNFVELLQGKAKEDPEAQHEFFMESEAQLDRLAWITQNLLDISRLEAGLTPLDLDVQDTGKLLERVASPFEMHAEGKGINLVINPPQPSFKIRVDRVLMELTLSNLIDNAFKFTPQGGEVELGAERSDQEIHLWVRDSGSGIDPRDLPHIFDRFYRGRNVSVEGSGLGLAMVASVVEAHGGHVQVESEVGAGSNFIIELPQQVTDEHGV